MKKRVVLLIAMTLVLLPLFSRPQFFLGGGVKWGRLYVNEEDENTLLHNLRYEEGGVEYVADILPYIEFTYVPSVDIGLGITGEVGWGGVLGFNNSLYTYRYGEYGYNFRTDGIFDASVGLRYFTLMDKERYLTFSSALLYNYRRYSLYHPGENGKRADELYGIWDLSPYAFDTLSYHSLSLKLGLMERYDGYYFRVDAELSKDLNAFLSSSFRFSVSASFGFVFTILKENEFMR